MSVRGTVWGIIGSLSIFPSMYQSTIFGASVLRQTQLVTNWKRQVPSGITPWP